MKHMNNNYPLAPEKLEISRNMLPNYCSSMANKYDIKNGGVNELVPNLSNKSKYVGHYRNLQLYSSLAMKLASVHRVLKFKQSDWLKKYIDFNTDKQKHANNSFEKKSFKLMNNSVHEKTVENLRKKNESQIS